MWAETVKNIHFMLGFIRKEIKNKKNDMSVWF